MSPTLSLCVSQYADDATPDGWERMGYINHWHLCRDGERAAFRSRVPLKRGHRYPVNYRTLGERGGVEARRGPVMLEVEVAGPNAHPYATPYRRESSAALRHIAAVRYAVQGAAGAQIVAEYTNAYPWRVMPHRTEAVDLAARLQSGMPQHHTASAYGKPSLLWFARTVYTLRRMSVDELPRNLVISHIHAGHRDNTSEEVAKQAAFIWPRLRDGDRLIYWASGGPERPALDTIRTNLDAVTEATI